jgi:prophage regulatory protein
MLQLSDLFPGLIAGAKNAGRAIGSCKTGVYDKIKDGLMTEPVSIGARAVAWPVAELAAINAARIAGWSDDEIRSLVRALHAQRKSAADGLPIMPSASEIAFEGPKKRLRKKSPSPQIESADLKPVAANAQQQAAAPATAPPATKPKRARPSLAPSGVV